MNYKKITCGLFLWLYFFSVYAAHKTQANLLITINNDGKAFLVNDANLKLSQNNTLQITQNNNCLLQPGSVTITNNSQIIARNINVLSVDPYYAAYVVQHNGCPVSLMPGTSCTISFYTNAAVSFFSPNIQVKGTNTNSAYFNLNAFVCTASLTSSVSVLGLAVSNTALNPGFTGHARKFVISNNSIQVAKNLSIQSLGFPEGTFYTTTCGNTLNIGDSCTITVTPGNTVSVDINGNACTIGSLPNSKLIVRAEPFVPTQIGVSILGYGCIYQSGFVFSIDDTLGCSSTPCIGGVGGKVISLIDQQPGFPDTSGICWSTNGIDGGTSYDLIPGIDDTSTTSIGSPSYLDFTAWFATTYPSLTALPASTFNSCNALIDGGCNSTNILAFYNEYITITPASNPPEATPLTYYAAGKCDLYTGGGYSDWYLPAICELGKEPSYEPCGTITTDNVVTNLSFLVDSTCSLGTSCLAGNYWSSTEWQSGGATAWSWYQYFASGGASVTHFDIKIASHGVRCVRKLTS